MANTYTQIHFHTVFAVKGRKSLISKKWEDELYKYITGIVQGKGHKMLQINGMPDHLHLLFGMRPTEALSDLMKDIKQSSSRWINTTHRVGAKFSWQEVYGAFAHSKRDLEDIIEYIKTQKEHHRERTFLEEYKNLLENHHIEYDNKYLFDPIPTQH